MSTSYSRFTFDDLSALGISVSKQKLFQQLPPKVEPSDLLKKTLDFNLRRNMGTEKAKSELIISPILNELLAQTNESVQCFSGYNFDVDKKLGLKGLVDFILSKKPLSPVIEAPVFCVVEAKNDNLDIGVAQCVAEMYAAFIFNQKKGNALPSVHGAVTFGLAWQFLRLENNNCVLDTDIYYLVELPQLLGILEHIVNSYK